jgi:threonine synthase
MKNKEVSPTKLMVGNTRLKKAVFLGKKLGFNSLFLKLEQDNPTHTHKDRAAHLIVEEAKKKGYRDITIGTCGNYGISLAYFCKKNNLTAYLFIPKNYSVPRLDEIKHLGAKIQFTLGTYEEAVDKSVEFSKKTGAYDANPHKEGAKLAISGYKEIAREIYNTLERQPTTVWIPVGNGTLLTGLYYGFLEIGHTPKLGATSSKNNNSITESFSYHKNIILKPSDLRETKINETLLNWRPSQFKESLLALKNSDGFAYRATDRQLLKARDILKSYENIETSSASAAALAGFLGYKDRITKNGVHIIVLTN